ncbi:MAG: hypothetical protein WC977_14835 [Anaerovoracaceae bacterium]
MAFLKNLGNKIGEVAGDAADKAKDLAETTKLKNEISGEQKKIQQALMDLGKLYYEDIKDAEEGPGVELCGVIKVAEAAIAELESKIELIKTN